VPVQAAQFHFADEAIKRRVYVAAQIRRELTTERAVGRRWLANANTAFG